MTLAEILGQIQQGLNRLEDLTNQPKHYTPELAIKDLAKLTSDLIAEQTQQYKLMEELAAQVVAARQWQGRKDQVIDNMQRELAQVRGTAQDALNAVRRAGFGGRLG